MANGVREFLTGARESRRRDAVGVVAAANLQIRFEEIDRLARELRDAGWIDGAEQLQRYAEIAYGAARAELRGDQGAT